MRWKRSRWLGFGWTGVGVEWSEVVLSQRGVRLRGSDIERVSHVERSSILFYIV